MDPIAPTSTAIWPVFFQGLALSFGLIVAIGAQNAFVLRQGLRREHVGSVVLFCAAADAMLIMAGVFGMAQALGDRPEWARALALAGAAFLAWYGWKALMRMRNPDRLQAACADPIGAFLIFLDLLKGNAKTFAEFFLAQPKHVPPQSNPAAHVNIDWIRSLLVFGHHNLRSISRKSSVSN